MNETFLRLTPTAWVAILTAILTLIAIVQVCVYVAINSTTKTIERAFVDMSHQPPGLDIGPDRVPRIKIGIKNHGNTPAEVVSVVLEWRISAEPLEDEVPDLRPKTPQRFFLMPHESVTWEPDDPLPLMPAATFAELRREGTALKLWIIGYVDYIDRFHRRFRNYYTRYYSFQAGQAAIHAEGLENNLLIETKPGYNTEIEVNAQGRPKLTLN